MRPEPDEIQKRIERFQDALKRAGVKLTHQRIEIFRELAQAGDHPDADTIYRAVRKRLPTVSHDTVYRTLWLLMDLGVITTLGTPRERVKFDANLKRHHHFVCKKCGVARDFYDHSFDVLEAPESVKELGSVETAHVEFRGLCSGCAKAG